MVAKFIPMRYGEAGDRIIKVQKMLQKAGSKIQANGIYSIGMVSAVKSFQKKNGLKITGIVDAATMNKLCEYDIPQKKTRRKKA